MNTALTPEVKRMILQQYAALRAAIDAGMAEDDVAARAVAFQQAYIGESRPLVDAFGAADDRADWARQVGARLAEEIEPEWWPPAAAVETAPQASDEDALGAAVTSTADDLVPVPLTCEHCHNTFEARCAPMEVALSGIMPVTDHTLACPTCGRIGEHALPGPVVELIPGAQLPAPGEVQVRPSDPV